MTEINTGAATMMESEPAEEMSNVDQTGAMRYEMTEKLSAKMHVTLEEAKAALEAADWNMLTATLLLEQEAFKRKQALYEAVATAEATEETTPAAEATADDRNATVGQTAKGARGSDSLLKRLGRAAMDLIARGNRSRFAIHRSNEKVLEMPVTVLALLLIFSFGTCAFLMAVGLFAGCRYTITDGGVSAAEA